MCVTLLGRLRGLPHDDDVAVSFRYSTVVRAGSWAEGSRMECWVQVGVGEGMGRYGLVCQDSPASRVENRK
jgi:hypothetical protein